MKSNYCLNMNTVTLDSIKKLFENGKVLCKMKKLEKSERLLYAWNAERNSVSNPAFVEW